MANPFNGLHEILRSAKVAQNAETNHTLRKKYAKTNISTLSVANLRAPYR